jgi:hypothetical protein
MNTVSILKFSFSCIFIVSLIYLSACDSGGGLTTSTTPPPPAPNPYGEGNGKITFIRTQQIDGPVTIKISNKSLNDSIVWQAAPPCDTNISASQILKAGSYSVKIEGSVFMCNYNVTVEERKCKILDYTNCNGGYIGCTDISGIWLRTSDGPCPNCKGLKIEFRNGEGEIIYTPPGCRFPLYDIKWNNFNLNDCTINDLARDSLGGSPEFQPASMVFENKNSFIINGPSGTIPYSRISQKNDEKISENIKHHTVVPFSESTGLQTAR